MNQLREWCGQCQECGKQTDSYTMSMFDVSLICMECADAEQEDPRYVEARAADEQAIRSGNYNFKGIGRKERKSK